MSIKRKRRNLTKLIAPMYSIRRKRKIKIGKSVFRNIHISLKLN
jgi:hypothetical protein